MAEVLLMEMNNMEPLQTITCKKCKNHSYSNEKVEDIHYCPACGAQDIEVKSADATVVADHNDIVQFTCDDHGIVGFANFWTDRYLESLSKNPGHYMEGIWDEICEHNLRSWEVHCPKCGKKVHVHWIFAAIRIQKFVQPTDITNNFKVMGREVTKF